MPLVCPNCRSNRVNPALGLFDWIFRIFGRHPYWCQLCSTRFFPVVIPA